MLRRKIKQESVKEGTIKNCEESESLPYFQANKLTGIVS